MVCILFGILKKNKKMSSIAFQTIDWNNIHATNHPGSTGEATWKTVQFPGLRIRTVEYNAGYLADHWCAKGHIVQCLEGEFTSEMTNGKEFRLTAGMTYVVSDDLSQHRSMTKTGCKLLIIDGDFLNGAI